MDTPTLDRKMDGILTGTDCKKHEKPTGMPCFNLLSGNGKGILFGICNTRAKRAGFVGKINPQSLQKSKR